MEMMGPIETAGPRRHMAGDLGIGPDQQMGPSKSELLGEVSVPEHEKKSALIDKPFYKDRDRMAMMAAALSDGFGGMTLRGKTGMGAMNKLTMANAQKNINNNKTMDYLLQNNPEYAKELMKLPPEYRDQYMDLAMKSSFAGTDESSFAEQVRMFKQANPNATQAEALAFAKGGNGTNVTVNNGGGSFAETLGKQAAEWFSKKSGAYSNINDMERVVSTIEGAIANGDQLSGGLINYMPDDVQDLFAPQSQDVRRSVEKVIQSSLRETLGAQFTEKEGENVIKRTWNPQAPIEYNLRRTKQLLNELKGYAAGQDQLLEGIVSSNGDIIEYMNNNSGSERGVTADSIRYLQYDDPLESGINPDPTSSASNQPEAPKTGGVVMDGKTYYYNEATGDYETDD
jgi:hypothetical protein